jgi:alpha-mannosidase
LPAERSFVQTESDNIVVTAFKKAEDDSSLILRFYEWAGKSGDVSVQLPEPAVSASETDLMERPTGSVSVSGREVKVPTKAYEIKTVKVQFSAARDGAEGRQ